MLLLSQLMPAGMIALLALGMFGRYGMVLYQVRIVNNSEVLSQ